MKKMIMVLATFLLLATPATVFARQTDSIPTPIRVILGRPTTIPRSLDELYNLIQNGGAGWNNFTDCSEAGMTGSYIQWSMVNEIDEYSLDDHGQSMLILPAADLAKIVAPGGITFPSQGILKVSENTLFSMLIHETLDGKVLLCKQKGDLTVYGPGVQDLFDQLIPALR